MRLKATQMVLAILLFGLSQAEADILRFNDGGNWDIDYRIDGPVWVDHESPGMGTTVNFLDGAITSTFGIDTVRCFKDGIINIRGGSVHFLDALDNSQVNISGGAIGQALAAFDTSQINVSGGAIDDIYADDTCQINIFGGLISDLHPQGSSQVAIFGGSVNSFGATGSSQIAIFGGAFGKLGLQTDAILTMYGSGFAVDGTPVDYIELTSLLGDSYGYEPYRQLTGTLLSGEPLNSDFRIGHNAKIVLVAPVPLPGAVLLGMLGLGVAGMKLRKQ